MKTTRLLTAALILLTLAFAGCSKKDSSENAAPAPAQAQDQAQKPANSEPTQAGTPTNDVLGVATQEEKIVFTVKGDYKLESDAWLGIVPTGTIYKGERDADDVDIIYAYRENADQEGAKDFKFLFDKSGIEDIEDGTYDLVFCSSDNEEVGKILFQIGIELKGSNITLDFENKK